MIDTTCALERGATPQFLVGNERNAETPFFLYLSYNAPHAPMQVTPKYRERYPDIRDKRRQTYAGMVSAVDDGVGKVMETIERLELNEKTLVFFLSDNGGPTHVNASQNLPLRGGKGDIYEGGVRVPFAVRWDGVLPAGKKYDLPVSALVSSLQQSRSLTSIFQQDSRLMV